MIRSPLEPEPEVEASAPEPEAEPEPEVEEPVLPPQAARERAIVRPRVRARTFFFILNRSFFDFPGLSPNRIRSHVVLQVVRTS